MTQASGDPAGEGAQIDMSHQESFSQSAATMPSNPLSKKLTGRGFAIRIGAFFASIFIANGIMVFYALSTFDGVETENAYSRGRAYNHVLEAEATQAALGWQVEINTSATYGPTEILLDVAVTVTDKDNKAVALAPIPLSLRRPTMQGIDASTTLAPQGNGLYAGTIRLAKAGNWLAWFRATTPSGLSFVYEERLFVPRGPEQSLTDGRAP